MRQWTGISISSGNGLSPVRQQAIIWTNAGLLSIELLGTNFSEIQIGILSFSFKKMHLKLSSAQMAAILSRGRWVNSYPQALHIYIIELGHHWFIQWDVTSSASINYLNQWWLPNNYNWVTDINENNIKTNPFSQKKLHLELWSVNYANPVYGVATFCHQVRWLHWGHPSLFHTATSLLIWYKMFCVRDISYRLIWMEFINMFSVYAQSGTHSCFNW